MKEFVESKPEKEFTKMGDIAREMFRKLKFLFWMKRPPRWIQRLNFLYRKI
jgi:hypothetical protein